MRLPGLQASASAEPQPLHTVLLVRGFRHVGSINLSAEAGVFAERWPNIYARVSSYARQSHYSVNSAQCVRSGLPPAAIRSLGAGSLLKYKWSESITTMAFFEYQRLWTAAAESPLIDDRGSPNQVTVGLGISYSFVVGR